MTCYNVNHGSLRPWSAIKDIERTHWSMVAREAITRWNLPPDALAAINAALTPGSRSKCA